MDLLFIHHSCGGQWLAPAGLTEGSKAIYLSAPNGGNLRALLEQNGFRVHEASYGSRIGQNTDLFDWAPKFRDQMPEILRCEMQDQPLPEGRHNQVVMFKSCYPNNAFKGEGVPPGQATGPEWTVWNAKAAYAALLPEFQKQPGVLFICVTAPPLAAKQRPQPLWRQLARRLKGTYWDLAKSGPWARQFNAWLSDPNGWLKEYPLKNVAIFDYYDILTGHGQSNFSMYPTGDGYDSHPSREGNEKAAAEFVPFLRGACDAGSVNGNALL